MNTEDCRKKHGVTRTMRDNMLKWGIIQQGDKITGEHILLYKQRRKEGKQKIRKIQKKKLEDSRYQRKYNAKPRKRNKDGKVRGSVREHNHSLDTN